MIPDLYTPVAAGPHWTREIAAALVTAATIWLADWRSDGSTLDNGQTPPVVPTVAGSWDPPADWTPPFQETP